MMELADIPDLKSDELKTRMGSTPIMPTNNYVVDGECWIWQGAIQKNGYGRIRIKTKLWLVHKLVASIMLKDYVSNLKVCHSCDIRRCIRPAHLFMGTQSKNMQDCVSKGRHASTKKTHCKHGHEFNTENTKIDRHGYRVCKLCQKRNLNIYRYA